MKEVLERILTVEDVIAIEGRGVIVMPWIPRAQFREKSPEIFVAVRKPNGSESRMLARFSMPHVPHPDQLCFGCIIVGAKKEDVPIGSDIYRFVVADEKA